MEKFAISFAEVSSSLKDATATVLNTVECDDCEWT